MLADYAELLYGQAALAEGMQVPDPATFSRLVAELMVKAAGGN
jgi:HSP90 family molecular chaperone